MARAAILTHAMPTELPVPSDDDSASSGSSDSTIIVRCKSGTDSSTVSDHALGSLTSLFARDA